jgi:NAD(P)-dependent dehydrogenase (short-subunit alcohol dehydrogenase family)
VDVLVNNAGTVGMALVEDWQEAAIRRDVDTNLLGAIWMSRAVWPTFRAQGGGRIVNISSHSAFGSPYLAVHGAVKAAALGLTRGLALEGMPHGIRVNALAPQALTVKHTLHLEEGSPFLAAAQARTVDQVAPALAYLAHDSADFTGRFLYAGGGVIREYLTVQTEGITDPSITLEALADRLAEVGDPTGAVPVPVPDPSIYALMTPKANPSS